MTKLRPPVNPTEELAVGKYCYNAGNVNLYQAQQIAQYFGIKALPAVVVDGNVLSSVSASAILKAME
jgi:thioredoxin-like negative regulator of GroEL